MSEQGKRRQGGVHESTQVSNDAKAIMKGKEEEEKAT